MQFTQLLIGETPPTRKVINSRGWLHALRRLDTYRMDFDAKVRQRARTMWLYSVGIFSAIVGGVIFARWGSKKGHTNEPALDKLPSDMRTGIISPRYSRRQACEHLIPVIIASRALS